MGKNSKRFALTLFLVFALLGAGWLAYAKFISPTNIAVISFPGFTVEKMRRANSSHWIKIKPLELADLKKIERYPLALIRGHGVRITPEQLEQIRKASEKGVKIYVADVTNPEYDLTNLAGAELDYFTDLMENKGSQNFRSLFNYTRKHIDGKKMSLQPHDSAVIFPDD
ncbi:MAG: hypothetical protein ACOCWD_04685, partial [Tangfeifania sp.]